MRLKNNFELRNVCGENVLIPCGKGGVDLNCIIHLNETGAFLWNEARKGEFDLKELVASLVDNYDVSESVAENDVNGFIEKLIDNNIATV